ncbi:acetate/propionate family kinase [Aurantimonas endophytica]|uniref:Acetate kinase n=1 Tax=Aurantimonas endophytica TaxID=1522175 RepID=A0A7W6HFM2_9HYPH|nr:acetate/propionate family kinase [Aurantimonas endophytica]MBB4004360.1 acetate kinase [Aurantimonas endophytica]MCO6405199.1 acetate/propionate family kinase [Aurantimonas endophytica]
MADLVLSLNAGSSSVKFGLHRVSEAATMPEAVARGAVKAEAGAWHLSAMGSDGTAGLDETVAGEPDDLAPALARLLAWAEEARGSGSLLAVGHRVVHGGPDFADPVRLTPERIAAIGRLTPLAPLHQPRCLAPIRALTAIRPDLLQTASFDTAFHRSLSGPAARYGLPRALEAEGIRRYGFHGLSYDFIAGRLEVLEPGSPGLRTVIAHLGNGASLCALKDGRSVDTTMGFSVLDGLLMGTRPGTLDPGVLVYLMREHGYGADQLEEMLYHRSGLLGVSGRSSDMRDLLGDDSAEAGEAVDLFVTRGAQQIAMMATSLAGLDRLVFTGGIGEHQPEIRAAIGRRLAFLGVVFDPAGNDVGDGRISADSSRVTVLVVPTDEEAVIARDAAAICRAEGYE